MLHRRSIPTNNCIQLWQSYSVFGQNGSKFGLWRLDVGSASLRSKVIPENFIKDQVNLSAILLLKFHSRCLHDKFKLNHLWKKITFTPSFLTLLSARFNQVDFEMLSVHQKHSVQSLCSQKYWLTSSQNYCVATMFPHTSVENVLQDNDVICDQ